MGDLLDGYVAADAFDEMFDGNVPRDHYRQLNTALQTLSRSVFDSRCDARDQAFRDQGITFSLLGEERPFPLDLVPRIIPADEWSMIEAGVRQRVRALEAFLDVAERHVLIARGRDYDDVPPLQGVYHGAPGEALGVEVELTRIA